MFTICPNKLGPEVKYCLFMNEHYIHYHTCDHKYGLYDIENKTKKYILMAVHYKGKIVWIDLYGTIHIDKIKTSDHLYYPPHKMDIWIWENALFISYDKYKMLKLCDKKLFSVCQSDSCKQCDIQEPFEYRTTTYDKNIYEQCCGTKDEIKFVTKTSENTYLANSKFIIINKNHKKLKTNWNIQIAHLLKHDYMNIMLIFKHLPVKLPRRLIITNIIPHV